MNKTTTRILSELLQDDKLWERKTGKPMVRQINTKMNLIREGLFYDEVYFPHVQRFMQTALKYGFFKEYEMEDCTLGYSTPFDIPYPVDLDLQIEISECVQMRLESVWYGEDWCYEEVAEDEIYQLGISPSIPIQRQLVLF